MAKERRKEERKKVRKKERKEGKKEGKKEGMIYIHSLICVNDEEMTFISHFLFIITAIFISSDFSFRLFVLFYEYCGTFTLISF